MAQFLAEPLGRAAHLIKQLLRQFRLHPLFLGEIDNEGDDQRGKEDSQEDIVLKRGPEAGELVDEEEESEDDERSPDRETDSDEAVVIVSDYTSTLGL